MKTCETCGCEIATKDGENQCPGCERKQIKRKEANARRREMNAAMRSIGMVKVRGAMGGTYWE